MVDASGQPHVVVTLEPNPWVAFYFDINIANTGNAPAYNIEVLFDPLSLMLNTGKKVRFRLVRLVF
jgi:hypothetical protein